MDIISTLSDDLLLRILSCLPTIKDVVATNLLSKRWCSLWMLLPKLEYDDTNHSGDYKIFSQFIYRSLLSNQAPVLQKLRLSLGPKSSDYSAIDIRLWINFAVSRSVRELQTVIISSNKGSVSLPRSLYASDTLETLRLAGYILWNAAFPVCLPSLKHLRLREIDYTDGATLPQILSGCPKLEGLFVDRYVLDKTEDVAVVVPSLKRLTLLDKTGRKCKGFVIDAPGLKYLNIGDNVDHEFRQIENMPELVEARVDIVQKVTHKFLKALTSVQRLSLRLSLAEVTGPSGMIFGQLVHLELYTITEGWWDLLTLMLQVSPKLKTLKLNGKHDSGDSGIETAVGWKPPSFVPECLLSSLEAFEWIGYKGREGDKMITTYILKNAACLKTATFSPESTDLGEKYRMLKELASVASVLSSCQILFD